jgi:hypothetical protein
MYMNPKSQRSAPKVEELSTQTTSLALFSHLQKSPLGTGFGRYMRWEWRISVNQDIKSTARVKNKTSCHGQEEQPEGKRSLEYAVQGLQLRDSM